MQIFFRQYFAWNNLTLDYSQQLVSITNESRHSLQLIVDKAFKEYTCLQGWSSRPLISGQIESKTVAFVSIVYERCYVK